MSTPVNITAGTLTPPACYSDEQSRLEAFVAAMVASLAGDFAAPLIQSTTPDPADNDKLWIKLDGGSPEYSIGFFLFQDGEWRRALPLDPPPGTIMLFSGNADIVLTGDFATDSDLIRELNDGTVANPYWVVCDGTNSTPDLRGRVPVGAGQGAGLTDRVLNATGGAETHTLVEAELPEHEHGLTDGASNAITARGAGPGYSFAATGDGVTALPTEPVGDDEPHNNMQPFIVSYYIMRTARLR